MARSTAAAVAAAFFLLCSLLLLSHAADTATTSVTEDSKRVVTQALRTTTVSTIPLTKEALEATFIPVPVDQIHFHGPLKDLKGLGVGDDRRPIHVRFFQTHRPLLLNIRRQTGDAVKPKWLGGRRMGAGLRFHRGHRVNCDLSKSMMELTRKEDGFPMMQHHHLRHKHHHDVEEKKEGGVLMKWLRGFLEKF